MKQTTRCLYITLLFALIWVTTAAAQENAKPVDLSTPRSSLQNFIDSARAGDYARAAKSLDERALQNRDAAREAWRLKFVLDQTLWIDWEEIPDTANGYLQQEEEGPVKPRRTLKVGDIPMEPTDVAVQMERVTKEGETAWLISAATVRQIPRLYDKYGIGVLGEYIPPGLQTFRLFEIVLWQWIGLAVFLIIAVVGGKILQTIAINILTRLWPDDLSVSDQQLKKFLERPIFAVASVVIYDRLVFSVLALSEPAIDNLAPLVFIFIVFSVAWLVIRSITALFEGFGKKYAGRVRDKDDVRARMIDTQVLMMRRIVNFMVFVVAAGISLYQFELFRTIGTSLLASAGIAGVILGIAAQRTMGNIFAGIQLALTQPVRIGDSVVFEGEWGWIEEITYTYVVIRIWDLRRLVIPINYLLDRPIQNWTRNSSDILGTVYIYTDYRFPVDVLREELKRIVDSTDLWDGKVQLIQVTDCKQETMELRALCSAKSAPIAWDLRCLVRERLIAFLQQYEHGRFLPRTRVELHEREMKEEENRESEGQKLSEVTDPPPEPEE